MKQYLDLLTAIKERGTRKPPARPNMPGSTSLFGYQFRHDLSEGFPLLTTKKMFFRGVVEELIWFLNGDTNVKYLIDKKVNIWNQDAYNYYKKRVGNVAVFKSHPEFKVKVDGGSRLYTYEEFVENIRNTVEDDLPHMEGYTLGDCGFQYGRVWRYWGPEGGRVKDGTRSFVDQIATVIDSLKERPESRRHIVTAIDPEHQDDLALYWCHALFQFNCRKLSEDEKMDYALHVLKWDRYDADIYDDQYPQYYLDCQLYQRSADVFLGVPFNVASYALLTHILAEECNMIPGEFVHTFGDVHIYDNHMEAVDEQLTREPLPLPRLKIDKSGWKTFLEHCIKYEDFVLEGYEHHEKITAELSTGMAV